jgi:hypothetical protein
VTSRFKPRRSPNDPPPHERHDIERRIRRLPLMRHDAPGLLDWPRLAQRLAEELRIVAARLAGDPAATDADRERIERSRAVVRDYERAAAVEKED